MFTGEAATYLVTSDAVRMGCGMHCRSLIPSGMWLHLARMWRLSSLEMQIVQHAFDNRKLESIAFELGISPHTADTYIRRLYAKIQVSSRPQLILRVMAGYLTLLAPGVSALTPLPCAPAKSEDLSMIPSETWLHLARILRLSSREVQIVQFVFDDQKLVSIALELGISRHTVTTYFQRLYTKMHVASRPQLILRVMAEYLTFFTSGGVATVTVPDGQRVS